MKQIGKYILAEKNVFKKIELVYYLKNKKNLFFDNSVLLKMEIANMFISSMCLKVNKNAVLTACLVYSLNKVDTAYEKERIKTKKKEDYRFLKSIGFTENFCRLCMEYNRVNQSETYKRTREGDVLELVENFGGLLLHRENRLAYSVSEAIDLLENKVLKSRKNVYLEEFKMFVDVMESASKEGLITDLQKRINKIDRAKISDGIRAIYDNRDLIENVFLGSGIELFEEQVNYLKLLKIARAKTIELIRYNQKMRKKGINIEEGLFIK